MMGWTDQDGVNEDMYYVNIFGAAPRMIPVSHIYVNMSCQQSYLKVKRGVEPNKREVNPPEIYVCTLWKIWSIVSDCLSEFCLPY